MPFARYFERANAHYYARKDPFGRDFTTAPELSQAFGECLGLWSCDLWDLCARPEAALVELGPGRGVLMADALRAAAKIGWRPEVHLVETSPRLRAEQARRVPAAVWHDTVATLPEDRPLIVLANEFFDALPVERWVRTASGWAEQHVGCGADGALALIDLPAPPPPGLPTDAAPGAIVELRPHAERIVGELARRLARQGGAMLIVDYGAEGAIGDTLQAMRGGEPVPLFADPGESDLTAHVDFVPLKRAALDSGCAAFGPIPQGTLLGALGLHERTAALARANPAHAARLQAAALRLTAAQHMGALFKAVAVTGRGWPAPAGFPKP
jgi:SAM-dependent MidA family methyltransferase